MRLVLWYYPGGLLGDPGWPLGDLVVWRFTMAASQYSVPVNLYAEFQCCSNIMGLLRTPALKCSASWRMLLVSDLGIGGWVNLWCHKSTQCVTFKEDHDFVKNTGYQGGTWRTWGFLTLDLRDGVILDVR